MDKLAKNIRTGANTIVEYDIVSKINELVEEWNSHKEWHRRFFDKYNKAKSD